MPLLLGLASETILHVCDYLDPYDVQSFSCCNQYIFELTEEKRYRSISFGNTDSPSGRPCHPFMFLNMTLLSPRYATYPRTVTIGHWAKTDNWFNEPIDPEVRYEKCTALSSYPYFKAEHFKDLFDRIAPTNRYSAFAANWATAILVMLLPNIRVIHGRQGEDVAQCVDQLVTMVFPNGLPWSAGPHDWDGCPSKLYEVHMGHHEGVYNNGQVLRKLSRLPSIRVLRGYGLYVDAQEPHKIPICNPKLRELELLKSYVDHEALEQMIRDLTELKKFTYGYDSHLLWRPRAIIDILQQYSSNNLTHLDLSVPPLHSLPFTGTFHGFTALKEIRLSSRLLDTVSPAGDWGRMLQRMGATIAECRSYHQDPPRLVDLLPASIEKLTLVGCMEAPRMTTLLDGLVTTRDQRVPSLTRIVFRQFGRKPEDCRSSKQTKESLQNLGLKIEFFEWT